MKDVVEIKTCEVCGGNQLQSVLDLGAHPLCDDLVEVGDPRICKEYPIEILFCGNCITAHQRFQVPKRELFPNSYHYRSRFTADVLNGMKALVDACENRLPTLKDKKVLDIGCNDGSLLDFFRAKGAVTIGIEPTGAYADAKANGHSVYHNFLSKEVAEIILKEHGKPDVITFTNVFAHIENLSEVLDALRLLISKDTLIVIENHYLGAVLERNQFDTFYHEHPRTYSFSSFSHIAKNLGIDIQAVEFPSRYGGNIRVFMGGNAEKSLLQNEALIAKEKNFVKAFENLRLNIKRWQATKGELIASLKKTNKKLRAKAFPGRAAILIKMLGIDETVISSVFEKPGSMKIGHYVPGTRIPIHSDNELFADNKEEEIVNFAWHIPEEIKSYLFANGVKGKIIDVLEVADFQ